MALGAICFATIMVSAAIVLSNSIATPNKNVSATEITLSLAGSGSGTGNDWSSAPAYGGDAYYQNILATMNSFSGNYYIHIVVKEDTLVIDSSAWNFQQKVDLGTMTAMTYNAGTKTWTSASAITASGASDALLFDFVCGASGYSASNVNINFVATDTA